MDMTDQDYGKLVNKKSKPSPMWKNMLWAFVVGGLICCIGQGFQEWYQSMGLSKTDAGTAVTITLVLLSACSPVWISMKSSPSTPAPARWCR